MIENFVEKMEELGIEFWSSGTEERFEKYAEKLIKLGMSEEDTLSFLSDVYSAVSGEFGE